MSSEAQYLIFTWRKTWNGTHIPFAVFWNTLVKRFWPCYKTSLVFQGHGANVIHTWKVGEVWIHGFPCSNIFLSSLPYKCIYMYRSTYTFAKDMCPTLYFLNFPIPFRPSSSHQNCLSLFQTQPLKRRHKNKWPACGNSWIPSDSQRPATWVFRHSEQEPCSPLIPAWK